MIPLRDSVRASRVPVVTHGLLAANVLVFAHEVRLGPALEPFLATWGLVPRRLEPVTLLTSQFLHAGWLHLAGNLLYLHIFGDNVEDRLGRVRFAVFYLTCGVVAGLAQSLAHPGSGLPMVGASGAIAGVSGAYLWFFPRARVVTLVPVFLFVQVVELPAVVFLVVWFVWQVASGVSTVGGGGGGVAFWAHVGGFVAGLGLGPVLGAGRRRRRR